MSDIRIINIPIPISELKIMATQQFGSLIKAVVDIEKRIMAIGGEMHADEELVLLENGSKQQHIWGINIYPDLPPTERIEFDSMINIRPYLGNYSRKVEDASVQKKIIEIVNALIQEET